MKIIRLVIALFIASFAGISGAHASVTLPKVLADAMVLQRQMPVRIWGKAAAGERVSVSFRGETKATTPDTLGYWEVFLSPGSPGGPFQLTVRGSNEIRLRNVLVGDVWVASG